MEKFVDISFVHLKLLHRIGITFIFARSIPSVHLLRAILLKEHYPNQI